MKKKFLLPMALLGATVMLASCSVSGLDAYRQADIDVYTRAVYCGVLDGYEEGSFKGDLLEFVAKQGESYQYFNCTTGKVVLETSTPLTKGTYHLSGKEDETTTLYDLSGKALATTTGEITVSDNQMFVFAGNRAFCASKTTALREIKNYSPFDSLPVDVSADNLILTNKYNYVIDNDFDSVRVYDEEFNFKNEAMKPTGDAYFVDDNFFLLASGDILYQYATMRPDADTSDDYDIILSNGTKYDLITQIYHVNSGNWQTIEADFIIYKITNRLNATGFGSYFSDGVPNVANIMPITNKRVESNKERMQMVTMNDDGTIVGRIDNSVVAQDGTAAPVKGTDYYIVSTRDNALLLVDRGGKVIADVTQCLLTSKYIVAKDGIYDYNMKKLYTLGEKDYAVTYGEIIVVAKTDEDGKEYFFYRDGKAVAIDGFENYTFSQNYYAVEDGNEFTYYNAAGKELLTLGAPLQIRAKGNDYLLMVAKIDNYNEYYYFYE